MRHQQLLPLIAVFLLVLFILTACPTATPTPTTMPPTDTPAATEPPTTAPAATDTPTPVTGGTDEEVNLAELEALVAASLGLTATVPTTGSLGIEGVSVIQLDNTLNDTPFWLAHSYGLRNFETMQNHVIAIYTRQNGAWQEVTRLELADTGDPENPATAPDYLDKAGVTQVQIEPAHLWLQVEGGVGAHSGVYGLYSFDGATLTPQVSGFSSSPGVGKLEDLNGDGVQEVVLDTSDFYVFCYACGVRKAQYDIARWDGAQMTPVTITALSETVAADLRALNDEIVQLAQAGLWKDALATIEANSPLPTDDETFTWNMIYLRYNAEAKRAETEDDSTAYPLLEYVFYGDFEAAIDIMRDAGADAIFITDTPLVSGTVAAGWEPALADWIIGAVDPALALKPDLAAAYFLRGWANYLKTQDEAAALPDVQKAVEFAPDDEFYIKSVDFLGG